MKWILLFLFAVTTLQAKEEFLDFVQFIIVSPSYNNASWCEASLASVASQTYPHWSLVYINDASTDNTGHLVEQFIRERQLSHKCTVIHNKKRVGAMANLHRVISSLPGNVVVVNLDGDDRFAHPDVLSHLAQIYADRQVWITYGNYRPEPPPLPPAVYSVCAPFPPEVIQNRTFRSYPPWVASHLKTYYAKLFHKIKKKDLCYRNKFVQVASDLAFMYPMLEMASCGHIRFVQEVLYVYNRSNPLNDEKKSAQLVRQLDKKIRHKKRYKSLKKIF